MVAHAAVGVVRRLLRKHWRWLAVAGLLAVTAPKLPVGHWPDWAASKVLDNPEKWLSDHRLGRDDPCFDDLLRAQYVAREVRRVPARPEAIEMLVEFYEGRYVEAGDCALVAFRWNLRGWVYLFVGAMCLLGLSFFARLGRDPALARQAYLTWYTRWQAARVWLRTLPRRLPVLAVCVLASVPVLALLGSLLGFEEEARVVIESAALSGGIAIGLIALLFGLSVIYRALPDIYRALPDSSCLVSVLLVASTLGIWFVIMHSVASYSGLTDLALQVVGAVSLLAVTVAVLGIAEWWLR